MNKYGSRVIQIPFYRLVVFYNATADQQDEMTLHLSDSFPARAKADIKVNVRMLNVNFGKNQELMAHCSPLMEYS